ncbi:MAG: RNA-binding domain-containing protein [Nitrososphaeria archaeon]
MKGKIRKMSVYVNVHATENEDLILSSLRSKFGDGELRTEKLTGHYGDEIKRLTLVFTKGVAEDVTLRLLNELGAFEKGYVLSEILKGLDRNQLFIRLDKQKLVTGMLELDGDKQIKIEVDFYSKKDAKEFLTK